MSKVKTQCVTMTLTKRELKQTWEAVSHYLDSGVVGGPTWEKLLKKFHDVATRAKVAR